MRRVWAVNSSRLRPNATPFRAQTGSKEQLVNAPVAGTGSRAEARGLWLGLFGVLIFSLTLPMTRLAVGTAELPQLSGLFIAFGRAAVAGLLSLLFLAATRAPLPRR